MQKCRFLPSALDKPLEYTRDRASYSRRVRNGGYAKALDKVPALVYTKDMLKSEIEERRINIYRDYLEKVNSGLPIEQAVDEVAKKWNYSRRGVWEIKTQLKDKVNI